MMSTISDSPMGEGRDGVGATYPYSNNISFLVETSDVAVTETGMFLQ